MIDSLKDSLTCVSEKTFSSLALQIYMYQKRTNPVYQSYLHLSKQAHLEPAHWSEIPCMPISFFKHHAIKSGTWTAETVFESSGTTGKNTSKHYITDLTRYQLHSIKGFELIANKLNNYKLFALLPHYLEKGNSGLLAMIDGFIKNAKPKSNYFLNNFELLYTEIEKCRKSKTPVILWGVTYALLDLIDQYNVILPPKSLLIETGGMKGKRAEMTKESLHEVLSNGIQIEDMDGHLMPIQASSEYGMTEMRSQAYSIESLWFKAMPSLKVQARDITDPFTILTDEKAGALNIYDLENIETCSFIQTDDIGIVKKNGQFKVIGRLSNTVIRGCNQLIS